MKKVLLVAILALIFIGAEAQQLRPVLDSNLTNTSSAKSKVMHEKAYGDILWSEDFSNGLPACWSIIKNNAGSIKWEWSTSYKAGMFSQNVSRINSTSASNGFMLLAMDSINTPLPSNNSQLQTSDTYFQSCAIPISPRPSVIIRLQQYYRFCCISAGSKTALQVSTDNFQTFDEYDLRTAGMNSASGNVEFKEVNVSQTLANADTAYLRFYSQGFSHYFWMVDDISIAEGKGQEIVSAKIKSNNNYAIQPFLTIQPLNHAKNISFEGVIKNEAGIQLSGVNLNVTAEHVNSPWGLGTGVVWSQNNATSNGGLMNPFAIDTVNSTTPNFNPSTMGRYAVSFKATSSQYTVPDSVVYYIECGDTTFAKDLDNPSSRVGPADYIFNGSPGGTSDGDRLGTLYNINSISQNVKFSSISFYISGSSLNIGTVIRPVVWEFSEANLTNGVSSAFGREVASSLGTFTVTANHLNSWQSLKLDTGIAMTNITNSGQFVVGWEMVSGTSQSKTFSVGNDLSIINTVEPVSSFVSFGHDSLKSWGWIDAAPMIRLNIDQLSVGLSKESTNAQLLISPNPSRGAFTITNSKNIQQMEIYSIDGKLIRMKQQQFEKIDLSDQPSGVYMLRIQQKSGEWSSEKLIKN